LVQERRRRGVQPSCGLHVEVEQARQGAVDRVDLGQVDRVAEPAQALDVVVGQRQRGGRRQAAPRRTVEVHVGRGRGEGEQVLAELRARELGNHLQHCAARRGCRRHRGCEACHGGGCRTLDRLALMCGIVGYTGTAAADGGLTPSGTPLDVALEGLRRLEYRGYDSAGVALVAPGLDGVAWAKKSGKLANLVEALDHDPLPEATAAIGHTRWATHGGPTDANAHPHLADGDRLALIHNGIVENFAQLKNELLADGVQFRSETDTEVAAHLVATAYRETGDLTRAMTAAARRLEGTFTLLAVHADAPDTVVGARHDSPLVVGLGDGENFLGSDVAAFIAHTKEALELGQDQVVTITPTSV